MTGAGVRIVDGNAFDVEAVMSVMKASFDPAYGEAWTTPQCAGLLPLPGVWLTLAMMGEEPLGFALGRLVSDEAELLLLAVRQDHQKEGIGRSLLNAFSQKAVAKGARTLHLEVRDGNPAVTLYSSSGFFEVGRRRNYYTGGNGKMFDALTLLKRV